MNKLTTKAIIEFNIYSYYATFKQFIGEDMYPMDIIWYNTSHTDDTTSAQAIPASKKCRRHKIRIEELTYEIHKHDFKSILFHEFTHLLDGQKALDIGIDYESTKAYTEIHAAFVQLMSSSGFSSISEYKNISLSQTIFNDDCEKKISALILTNVSDIMTFKQASQIERVIDHTFYHFGYLRFCEQFCKDNLSEFYYFDILEQIFGAGIKDIYDMVKYPFEMNVRQINAINGIMPEVCHTIVS